MTDQVWKAISLLSGLVVIPTFGWVWNTHTQLSNLQTEFQYTQVAVRKMEDNSVEIRLIQKDIQHMNEKIDELMKILVQMNEEK